MLDRSWSLMNICVRLQW